MGPWGLPKRIEQAGLKAFIDFRDFRRGAPSIKEMERGVVKCRKTLAVLTPDPDRPPRGLDAPDPSNNGANICGHHR